MEAGTRRISFLGWTLALFLLWSNSFIAISYLLGSDLGPARFDWLSLTVARFLIAGSACGAYCLFWRRQDSLRLLRRRWKRLLLAGFFCVPGYNFALYYGQQHGVPAPIASLTTALSPLFLMILGVAFLGEAFSRRKAAGFAVALAGLAMIARARSAPGQTPYPLLVLITALAPLSWSLFSTLSKPVSQECSPILWTFLAITVGTLPLLAVAPFHGMPQLLALDSLGWTALLFLATLCTVFGFAVWTWLLRHLPASSLGFTIFLNPPMTTLSKAAWAAAFPAAFAFSISAGEWLGGAVVLAGLAVALLKFPAPRRAA